MMSKTYKSPAENKRDNKKLNFSLDTNFFVLRVKDGEKGEKVEEKTRKDGTGSFQSPVGSYKIYNPDDDKVGWIPKWFLVKPLEERKVGDFLKWDDFNVKYQPDTIEWKTDTYPENTNSQDYERALKAYEKTDIKTESPKEEYFANYTIEQLRDLLKKNGHTDEDIDCDIDFINDAHNGHLDERSCLFLLCKKIGQPFNSKPEPVKTESEKLTVMDESEILNVMDGIVKKLLESIAALETRVSAVEIRIVNMLDGLTSHGQICLMDLLSKQKQELIKGKYNPTTGAYTEGNGHQ